MDFVSSDPYTLGAEWELQLLDRESLDLRPGIEAVLAFSAGHSDIKAEFIQSCVELNSPVLVASADLEPHFAGLVNFVLERCEQEGMTLAGAGTHPFCRRLALITPLPRFSKLAAEHGYIAHSQITFATHVHVGLPSGDCAMRVMRFLTPCLPLLIAVSANSPFWRGHETGYASYRRRLLTASRSYGIPPYFESWREFTAFYDTAKRAASIRTFKDIHWDIRPHPDFGTLEVRVMDSQSSVKAVVELAALVRVLVAWIAESPAERIEAAVPRRQAPWIDRDNHFRASHAGLDAELIHDEHGNLRPVRTYLEQLAEASTETARQIGEPGVPALLASLCEAPSGYLRQQEVYAATSDVHAVVEDLVGQLRGGSVLR